jgi:hypothetical protein
MPTYVPAHSGLGVIVAILLLALAASLLTLIASALLLVRYRRAVARLMSARAGQAGRSIDLDACSAPHASCSWTNPDPAAAGSGCSAATSALSEHRYRQMLSEPWCRAGRPALAGVLYALLTACAAYFAFSQLQVNYLRAASHPFQLLYLFWTFVWPVVLTLNLIATGSQLSKWRNVVIYLLVLAILGGLLAFTNTEAPAAAYVELPAWSGEAPLRLLAKWLSFNLAPTLLFAAFQHRRIRAVAPLVLGFMTIVCAGGLGAITLGFTYQEPSAAVIGWAADTLGVNVVAALIGYFLLLVVAACLPFAVLGWGLLVWIRRGYQRKTASDQSLAVDALWLMFTSFYAVMLAVAGPAWALSALLAFALFKSVLRLANARFRASMSNQEHHPVLLVLRVFALGKRSEALFEALSRPWRYIGSVSLIAGEDLALSTVAPHRFLDFVSGRLARLFIDSDSTLARSISAFDHRRDADGRFRINDFFCHADTWQAVLRRLIARTDVVVMDLRNLSSGNAGCVFEIRELLDTVPAERLVFIVDRTTDQAFLEQTWRDACKHLHADSPNRGIAAPALKPYELPSVGYRQLQGLLRRLCAAADAARPVPSPS